MTVALTHLGGWHLTIGGPLDGSRGGGCPGAPPVPLPMVNIILQSRKHNQLFGLKDEIRTDSEGKVMLRFFFADHLDDLTASKFLT